MPPKPRRFDVFVKDDITRREFPIARGVTKQTADDLARKAVAVIRVMEVVE